MMKRFLLVFFVGCSLISCKKDGCTDPTAYNYSEHATQDDGSCDYICQIDCFGWSCINGAISSNETWTADHIYEVCGKVVVESGVTLTIEPGTIIKFQEGTGSLASSLIISKGAKIKAIGTANSPIIFTSILDNIQLGALSGTNLNENDRGLWGGLIILGDAPISAMDGDIHAQIEGIPTTDTFGAFGGNNVGDDSGTLNYVSIRHPGVWIGAGNEINGLTLGGVGSGTTISNIEIIASLDDGIECLGGTVDIDNLTVGFVGDDGIDIDMNYSGEINNFTVFLNGDSDEAIEASGGEGVTYIDGMFALENGTVMMESGLGNHSRFNSRAKGTISNVDFNGMIDLAAEHDANCNQLVENCLFYLLESTPRLIFNSCNRTTISYTLTCAISIADSTAAEGLISPSSTQGNTNTAISWTWMGVNGKL